MLDGARFNPGVVYFSILDGHYSIIVFVASVVESQDTQKFVIRVDRGFMVKELLQHWNA